jgi:hypothetical protein
MSNPTRELEEKRRIADIQSMTEAFLLLIKALKAAANSRHESLRAHEFFLLSFS